MEKSSRLLELARFLQDPHLVARFQHICGVRGTFSRTAVGGGNDREATPSETQDNGACYHQLEEDHGGETMGMDMGSAGVRNRVVDSKKHHDEDFPHNGSLPTRTPEASVSDHSGAMTDEAGAASRVKPLRRNSLTGDAGQEFLIENRIFYYLFTFGTELGNEFFYITFFPFLLWNVDAFVSRRLIMVWVWVMYLGQCTKDVIGWSRPASPPVVKVEVFYNSEYSMPSTHAMSGTAIPFALFFMTCDRWEDVIVGVFYSILILLLLLPALDVIDNFVLTCVHAPLVIVCLHLGLGLFSFTLDTWSTSRGDTAQILGSGAGIALASHVNHRLGLMPDPERLPLSLPALSGGLVGTAALRFLLGVLVLVATRALMKALTIPLVCRLMAIPGDDMRKARQHMEVELPYRYIVYGTVGFNVVFLVPLLFSYLALC
ncbi:sphingosine-1-phosphate phosphatase 1 isoform X2 [Dunckerocampus dactyliophorus]|uniref:sphingosine-1-phosphate phosphatase 1 isoform X2 n=1 Tax=Dunckerocampus dactyliophorus TaxID=161453 RepID=UPI002405978C|nr:sphingosine-1-phosphate phosphatase 1 isoform X2 [Dunckerocampus dactyliophorus]